MMRPSYRDPETARRSFGCGADYFDADLDEFGSDQDQGAPLSWRMDGSCSLSDWTIVIARSSDESAPAVTYHVHRAILAVGPRSSEYFSGLFRSHCTLAESSESQSNIALEDSAADAFPDMLDYMYSADRQVKVTTNSAVALRYLAQYFGMRKLFVEVTRFIRDDLAPETAPMYLSEGTIYHDNTLIEAACGVCAMNMEKIESSLLAKLPSTLFEKIVSSEKMKCDSETLSVFVADFCKLHNNDVDKALLEVLTDHTRMPTVDPMAANQLLTQHILCEGEDTSTASTNLATSLQKRCIEALSANWQDGLATPLREVREKCKDWNVNAKRAAALKHREFPSSVQIELLEASLCSAEADLCKQLAAKEYEICKVKKELEALSMSTDAEIQCLKSELASKHSALNQIQQEAKKFIRVPCSHDFVVHKRRSALASKIDCTYESKVQVPSNGFYIRVHGTSPPTAMPMLCGVSKVVDGYLYKIGTNLWPVYYYKGS